VTRRGNGTPVGVLDHALAVRVGRERDLDNIAAAAVGLDVWLWSRHLIVRALLDPPVVVDTGVLGSDVSGDRNGVPRFAVPTSRVEENLGTSILISFTSATSWDKFSTLTQHTTGHHRHAEPGEGRAVRREGCSSLCRYVSALTVTATGIKVIYPAKSSGILTVIWLPFLRSLSVQNSPLRNPSCQILNHPACNQHPISTERRREANDIPPPATSPSPLSPILFMYTAHGPW